MKFKFDNIKNPLISKENRNVVCGFLPTPVSPLPVKVERYLSGFKVNLRISVNDIIWHDNELEKDEISQVSRLFESALDNESNIADKKRATINREASHYLLER